MNYKDYIVAQELIRSYDFDIVRDGGLKGFIPFATKTDDNATPQMELYPTNVLHLSDYTDYMESSCFDFEGAIACCHFGHYAEGYLFYMIAPEEHQPLIFSKRFDSTAIYSNIATMGVVNPALLRFGLWMMFGLCHNAHSIAIHSSVVVNDGRAVLFLGESGTGKSTHTRLWLKHIAGSMLLNDDSPIVRMVEHVPTAFGSPWSGKAPCYRNKSYPIAALVRIKQAPYNRITRLPIISAIGALLPSCPPAFAVETALEDNICNILSEIISRVPVYQLECLPDADAAQLSFQTTILNH
jgi:hypothetical protein